MLWTACGEPSFSCSCLGLLYLNCELPSHNIVTVLDRREESETGLLLTRISI